MLLFGKKKNTYSALISTEQVTNTKDKNLEQIFLILRQSFHVICLGSMKISVTKILCQVKRNKSPTLFLS